jgi:hypothetical protein
MTRTIKSLDQIRNADGKIYVRWSKSIALDNKRGYSLRAGTGREAGLSACEIGKDWDNDRILRQMAEYSFTGGSCWIITGREVGRGGDNEPLLVDVQCIGKVSDSLRRDAEIALLKYYISTSTYTSQRKNFEAALAKLQ